MFTSKASNVLIYGLLVFICNTSLVYAENNASSEHFFPNSRLADNGRGVSGFKLGEMFETGDGAPIKSDSMALFWYEGAASRKHVPAMLKVAEFKLVGKGSKINKKEAYQWYLKAAQLNDINAQYNVGYMLEKAIGVKKNYFDSLKWYKHAADKAHPEALNSVGVFYLRGLGVRQNKKIAKEWFGKACDEGMQKGCDHYRLLHEAGV